VACNHLCRHFIWTQRTVCAQLKHLQLILSVQFQFSLFFPKRHDNQTTQCKLKGYNRRPRRYQGPVYLGSPMNHRQIKMTTVRTIYIIKRYLSCWALNRCRTLTTRPELYNLFDPTTGQKRRAAQVNSKATDIRIYWTFLAVLWA